MLKLIQCYRWSRVLYLVPILLIFKGALLHLDSVYIGENVDSSFFIWCLGWFWHAVLTGQNPLVSHALNYPYGMNLMANTGIVAESILFGPLFYLVSPVFSFNALMLVDFLLIGVIGADIFNSLKIRPWLADFGAMLFGLSAFVVNQSVDGHINLISGYMLILALISIMIRVLQDDRSRPIFYGSLLGLIATVLFYTTLDMLAVAALILLCSFVIFWLAYRAKMLCILKIKLIKPFLLMSLVLLILALPGLYAFFFEINHVNLAVPIFPLKIYVNILSAFILPTQAQPMSLWYSHYDAESNGYLGVLAILLIFVLALRWRNKLGYCLLATAVFISLLSMGGTLNISYDSLTHFPLPWALIEKFPLMSDILPARLMAFADIVFIIFIILGSDSILKRKGGFKNWVICLLILTAISWCPNIPFWNQSRGQDDDFLRSKLQNQPVAIITCSFSSFGYYMETLSAEHYAFPVTNAYQYPYITNSGGVYTDLFVFTSNYQNRSLASAMQSLEKFVALRGPKYIIFFPQQALPLFDRGLSICGGKEQMPAVLGQSLNNLFGKPLQNKGVEIWTVK